MNWIKPPHIDGILSVSLEEMLKLKEKSKVFADHKEGWIAIIGGRNILILAEEEKEIEQDTSSK